MHTLRCVLAEWQLVRARLLRSRLGVWLLLLAGGLLVLALQARPLLATPLAVVIAELAAILCVAFSAGSDADRATLSLTLTHPTTPFAVAAGRWLAAVTATGLVMLATLFGMLVAGRAAPDAVLTAALAGGAAAGASAACALVAVSLGGNATVGLLFLYMAILSRVPPAALEHLFAPGAARSIAGWTLEVLPSFWRYRQLGTGHVEAWLHAGTWIVAGVLASGALLARRIR